MKKEWIVRWSFFIIGLIVLSFGVALTIEGKLLGIGPWDVLHYGLFLQMGLTVGIWSIIMGFLLIVITIILTKRLPKIGTFLNMLLMGLFIDFFMLLLPSVNDAIQASIFFFVGLILIGIGIGLYVAADVGSGPRDGMMILIVEKTRWPIQWVRNGMEVLVLILGWLLGGPVGVGTVIIAFLIGPIVAVAFPKCKQLLQRMLV